MMHGMGIMKARWLLPLCINILLVKVDLVTTSHAGGSDIQ